MHAFKQLKNYGRPSPPKIQRISKGTEFLKTISCLAPKWNKQLSQVQAKYKKSCLLWCSGVIGAIDVRY